MNEAKRKKLMQKQVEFPTYMMGTKAYHQLGEVSRASPDICYVEKLQSGHYYGSWVTGYGFFNVKFPVETTRELTEMEIVYYRNHNYQISNHSHFKLNL